MSLWGIAQAACPEGYELVARRALAGAELFAHNRARLLAQGFVQKGESQFYEGKGFLIQLFESGEVRIFHGDTVVPSYTAVRTELVKKPAGKGGGVSWEAWEEPTIFLYDQNGKRAHSYARGSTASFPMEPSEWAALQPKDSSLTQQIERTSLVPEPLSGGTVFGTYPSKDFPRMVFTSDGHTIRPYEPVSSRNMGYELDLRSAKVLAVDGGGILVDDGVTLTTIKPSGFIGRRELKEDVGPLVSRYLAQANSSVLPVTDQGLLEGGRSARTGALVFRPGMEMATVEQRVTDLTQILSTSRWAQGHKEFQGDMINAPLWRPKLDYRSQLSRDEEALRALGRTRQEIGTLLALVRKLGDTGNRITYEGRVYTVRRTVGIVQVIDRAGARLEYKDEFPELIHQFGYFGDPTTAARIEPARIVEFFGLK